MEVSHNFEMLLCLKSDTFKRLIQNSLSYYWKADNSSCWLLLPKQMS